MLKALKNRVAPALHKFALACAATLALGCAAEEEEPKDGIVIGLLLPFTGSSSATASNLERAAIYAADRINQGGGVKGQRIRIVARDTHSDPERSKRSAQELINAGAVVVIGPESTEIAQELAPLFAEQQVAFLSPLVGAANDVTGRCSSPWFRLAPSAKSLGEALAKQVTAAGVSDAAIMYAGSAYNDALRAAVKQRISVQGGRVALELELDPNAQSYAADVTRALSMDVDAVVLAMSPRAAALLVNEFDALSTTAPKWFLSPLLKTELLVQNVAPAALEGAVGVAPKVYDRSSAFPSAFRARWLGDEPLEGAYFYYDAISLVAFALAKSKHPTSERSQDSLQALETAMLDAAAPPGESTGWNEVEVGMERLRSGEDLYYAGLTGPLLLEPCGARRLGASATWNVHSGAIIDGE